MRKTSTRTSNSEEGLSTVQLSKQLRQINVRLAQLEAEVFGGFVPLFKAEPHEPVKGRPALLDPAVCVERRDRLASWLEQNWPFLSMALRQTKKSQDAIKAITIARKRLPALFMPPFYEYAEEFEIPLWEFLKSRRFHGNPRNLAGAMAGLPELSWKRSFDICAENPYTAPFRPEAIRDHMQRKFPDRLRELRPGMSKEEVLVVLARTRSKDPTYELLKEHPEEVLEWLKAGRPIAEEPSEPPKTRRRPPKRRM
jgi:hypothetical protein